MTALDGGLLTVSTAAGSVSMVYLARELQLGQTLTNIRIVVIRFAVGAVVTVLVLLIAVFVQWERADRLLRRFVINPWELEVEDTSPSSPGRVPARSGGHGMVIHGRYRGWVVAIKSVKQRPKLPRKPQGDPTASVAPDVRCCATGNASNGNAHGTQFSLDVLPVEATPSILPESARLHVALKPSSLRNQEPSSAVTSSGVPWWQCICCPRTIRMQRKEALLVREAFALLNAEHRSVVRVHGYCINPLQVVMEWMPDTLHRMLGSLVSAFDLCRTFHMTPTRICPLFDTDCGMPHKPCAEPCRPFFDCEGHY